MPDKLARLASAIRDYPWPEVAWSLFVVVVAIAAGLLATQLVLRWLSLWVGRTETTSDDLVLRHLERPLRWLSPILALTFSVSLLSISAGFLAFLQHALLIGAIAGFGWLAVRLVAAAEEVVSARLDVRSGELRDRRLVTQARTFKNVASFIIVLLTFAFVLMTFESVRQVGTGLLASAGVAGLVLGFAAQRTIATVLAGIQIAVTQPIRVGDVVIVENEWGTIEEITLTYVVVRIWDLRRLVVPINYFIEKPFQNWTRTSPELLGVVELKLDYGVPVDAVRQEVERILRASDRWDGKVSSVQVTAADDRTLTVRPLFSAKNSGDLWDLRCEVREKLIRFIQRSYPQALPRVRADFEPANAGRAMAGVTAADRLRS